MGARKILYASLVLLSAWFAAACATVPYTGREQLILVDEKQAAQMGNQAAAEVMQKERISHDPELNDMVNRVGRRIAQAANKPDYRWEFHVIDNDKTANAFALPGGKVFVYTGIMKYVQNEAQLAAIMGHEVAHVLARHGAERMSMQAATQLGGAAAGAALGGNSQLFQAAYGVAANYGVILPYSRSHESEADRIGLIIMAKAGYPPEEAMNFWRNMARGSGPTPPAFLSTHPATEDRIRDIQAHLPEARKYYRP